MTYKMGDAVTVRLDTSDAEKLNEGSHARIYREQIIKHEPAPEPIVYWRYCDGNERDESLSLKEPASFKWDHVEKLTLNPDGTYTVEVVK